MKVIEAHRVKPYIAQNGRKFVRFLNYDNFGYREYVYVEISKEVQNGLSNSGNSRLSEYT